MNIFEALSSGKGCINEENTSSFLAWLLSPYESHGLRDEFIKRFMKIIDSKIDTEEYDIKVKLECKYKKVSNAGKNRNLDIVIELKAKEKNNLVDYIIAIENKTKIQSAQATQFKDQYDNLRAHKDSKNKHIIMVLLAPDKIAEVKDEFEKLKKTKKGDNKVFLEWKKILEIITDIVKDSNEFAINPITDYLRHTLHAFVFYIKNNIVHDTVKVTYNKDRFDETTFNLVKLANGNMRITSDDENVDIQGLIPKHMIYDVLIEISPEEYHRVDNRLVINIQEFPQYFGNEMFKILKKKDLKEVTIKSLNPIFNQKRTRAGSNKI